MNAKTDLLPLPGWLATNDGAAGVIGAEGIPIIRRAMKDYARSNVEARTEALRAEVERLRSINSALCRKSNSHLIDAARWEERAERLAEALRGLLNDTQHKDHNCGDAEWCPVIAARAALEQEATNG
jgi:hypothetical protein